MTQGNEISVLIVVVSVFWHIQCIYYDNVLEKRILNQEFKNSRCISQNVVQIELCFLKIS